MQNASNWDQGTPLMLPSLRSICRCMRPSLELLSDQFLRRRSERRDLCVYLLTDRLSLRLQQKLFGSWLLHSVVVVQKWIFENAECEREVNRGGMLTAAHHCQLLHWFFVLHHNNTWEWATHCCCLVTHEVKATTILPSPNCHRLPTATVLDRKHTKFSALWKTLPNCHHANN